MAEEELQDLTLRDEFYRDSFNKLVMIIISIVIGILLLVVMSIYIYLHKPAPTVFPVGDDWRIQATVPVDQPYLSTPEVLQWVSNAATQMFNFDFNNYNAQLKQYTPYFTTDGWQIFLNQLNIYANYNKVQSQKMFVFGVTSGAPVILNDSSTGSLSSGRYAWLVQIPVDINYAYAGNTQTTPQTLTLQILVVRVPTLNNLDGVAIDNVEVAKSAENQ